VGSFTMLHTLGSRPDIREEAEALGYTDSDHDEGWRLLREFCEVQRPEKEPLIPKSKKEALAGLKREGNSIMARIEAGLGHYFPAQWDFIQGGINKDLPMNPVVLADILLESFDILAEGRKTKHADTREQDREAVRLLVARRILDEQTRERLKGMSDHFKHSPPDASSAYQELAGPFMARFETLHAWRRDWSLTFRAGIADKRKLSSLGLYNPRKRKGSGKE